MTISASVAVPTALNAFSAQLDAGAIDPCTVIGRLSKTLTPSDKLAVYASLDAGATGASANLTRLGAGGVSAGHAPLPPLLGGWRSFFVKRLLGLVPAGQTQ